MTVVTDTIRNGVDTEKMFATLDLIKAQPELARFQFRATNRWIDGSHNRSTIKDFYAAGGELLGELLGDRDEADAGVCVGAEFDRHGGISNPFVTHPWPERGPGHGLHASFSRSSPPRRRARRS